MMAVLARGRDGKHEGSSMMADEREANSPNLHGTGTAQHKQLTMALGRGAMR